VTDVEVELNLMAEVVAGRNEAMRGVALMACLTRSEADIVVYGVEWRGDADECWHPNNISERAEGGWIAGYAFFVSSFM
jgi:hypothetical protein